MCGHYQIQGIMTTQYTPGGFVPNNLTAQCRKYAMNEWVRGHESGVADMFVFLSATALVFTCIWTVLWFRHTPQRQPDHVEPPPQYLVADALHINSVADDRLHPEATEKTPVLRRGPTPDNASI